MKFLKGLGTRKKPAAASKTPKAVAERIKNILGISELETMPANAAKAFQLASDPASTSADFVGVIEMDEALSARVVRIANSVYFFRGQEATDIEKAVAVIGLNELRCLLSASMLKSMLTGKGALREQAWANAVGTAIACRSLAHHTNISDGEAFLCGLVHDIGKLILIHRGGREYEKVLTALQEGDKTFIEAEEEVFETNHAEVGKWAAEKWHFPQVAIDSIANHHSAWPSNDSDKFKATAHPALVKVGDTLSHAAGIGLPSSLRYFKQNAIDQLPHAFEQLGIPEEDRNAVMDNFQRKFEDEFGMYQLQDN